MLKKFYRFSGVEEMQFEHFDIVGSNTLGERFQTAVVIRLPEQNGIYLFPFGGNNGFAARFVRLMQKFRSYRHDEFYAVELTRSAFYELFVKRIVELDFLPALKGGDSYCSFPTTSVGSCC